MKWERLVNHAVFYNRLQTCQNPVPRPEMLCYLFYPQVYRLKTHGTHFTSPLALRVWTWRVVKKNEVCKLTSLARLDPILKLGWHISGWLMFFGKLMKWEGCVKWEHVNVMAAMWHQNVTYFPWGALNIGRLSSYFIKWKWAGRQIKKERNHNEKCCVSVEIQESSYCGSKAKTLTFIKTVRLSRPDNSLLSAHHLCLLLLFFLRYFLSRSRSGKSVMLESCQWVLRPVASWGARLAG